MDLFTAPLKISLLSSNRDRESLSSLFLEVLTGTFRTQVPKSRWPRIGSVLLPSVCERKRVVKNQWTHTK